MRSEPLPARTRAVALSLMGLHSVGLEQDRVSEPPVGEHSVSRVRSLRPNLQTVPPPVGEEERMAGGMACLEH